MIVVDEKRKPQRFTAALKLVLQRYAAQVRRRPGLTIPALLLPAIGDVLAFYVPPLIIARLLSTFATAERLSARDLVPYVLVFTVVWLAGETFWRIAAPFIARAEIRGIESLHVEAMDELLAKDLSFFHDNYAGSLTKKALGYARRFEDVFDVFCFQVLPNLFR
jgi:ATP-binding cassette, subfamily B, bacterial